MVLQRELAEATYEGHAVADRRLSRCRARPRASMGTHTKTDSIMATAHAKIRPVPVRVAASTRSPTMASFNSELRLLRQSCAAPRCSPIAASSRVTPHIVATQPTTNSTAVTGLLPITLRLFPRCDDSNIVAIARTKTIAPAMAMPVLNMTRRSSRIDRLDLGQEKQGHPEGADRRQQDPGGCGGRGEADVSGAKEVGDHGPIAKADQCGGTRLADEEPQRREETPDLRDLPALTPTEQPVNPTRSLMITAPSHEPRRLGPARLPARHRLPVSPRQDQS